VGREFNRRFKHNMDQAGIMLDVPGAPPFAAPERQELPKKRAASSRPG
jgi:hypothetical protein